MTKDPYSIRMHRAFRESSAVLVPAYCGKDVDAAFTTLVDAEVTCIICQREIERKRGSDG